MRVSIIQSAIAAIAAAIFIGCSDEVPMVSLGIDDSYRIERMRKLPLNPALTGQQYRWTVDGEVVSTDRNYIFIAQNPGTYHLSFDIIDDRSPFHHDFVVNVVEEEVAYSPYIAEVVEYCPAPGQFVNIMPQYEPGDSYADMLKKCTESIMGTNDEMISLGAYGGYVTFRFDHTVINVDGERDFRIWGNSFYELTDPEHPGGSAEPGIVMVSYDTNCNGLPDDPWYELAGSEHANPKTHHGYTITYRQPDAAQLPVEGDDGFLTDIHYIPWADSTGATGYVAKNMYHDQSYWPQWVDSPTLSFTGTCLPPNGVDRSGFGHYYILYCYDWGYVDNHPNDQVDRNTFDISWAVDTHGNRVHLPGADFVRVYTGVNQYCGWLGETSTEIARAQDLHIDLINYQ